MLICDGQDGRVALDLALLEGHLDVAKKFVRDGAGLDTAYPVRILQDGHVRKCIVCGHLSAFHILHVTCPHYPRLLIICRTAVRRVKCLQRARTKRVKFGGRHSDVSSAATRSSTRKHPYTGQRHASCTLRRTCSAMASASVRCHV